MTGEFEITELSTGDGVELRLSGVVDGPATEALRARLQALDQRSDGFAETRPRRVVVVDFSGASALYDVVCAALAEAPRPLRLRGLGEHQRRVLHYLHLELDADGELCGVGEVQVSSRWSPR